MVLRVLLYLLLLSGLALRQRLGRPTRAGRAPAGGV
jgi:hypothetical protein